MVKLGTGIVVRNGRLEVVEDESPVASR